MNRILSVAPLSVPDTDSLTFLDAAATAGFDHVGIRLKTPEPSSAVAPVVSDPTLRDELVRRVKTLNLRVLEVEAFWINHDFDLEAFKSCIALAAELSPEFILVVANDPDYGRLTDHFCQTVELANSAGMRTALEFISYTAIKNIKDAQTLVRVSGTNAGLLVDALHLSRAGDGPAQVADIQTDDLCILHLCDAHSHVPDTITGKRAEARGDRLSPGAGALPLKSLVSAVPANLPVEIECPVAAMAEYTPVETLTHLRQAAIKVLAP